MPELRGFAAALRLLRDTGAGRGRRAAITPFVAFLAAGGVDGLLGLGTTGERTCSRRTSAARRRGSSRRRTARLRVIVHCGAQNNGGHGRARAPRGREGRRGGRGDRAPYFPLDDRAIIEHFAAAASACAPLPFFLYEFAARSGYSVTPEVIGRLRERARTWPA